MRTADLTRAAGNRFHHRNGNTGVHDWYTLVAGFGSTFVDGYLEEAGLRSAGRVCFDPFMGMGTTLVTCKTRGLASIGCDVNPFAHFVASVKTTWSLDLGELARRQHLTSRRFGTLAEEEPDFTYAHRPLWSIREHLSRTGRTTDEDTLAATQLSLADLWKVTPQLPEPTVGPPDMPQLTDWVSPIVLCKCLQIKSAILEQEKDFGAGPVSDLIRLAFASVLMPTSNMQLAGPKICYRRRKGQRIVCLDGPVFSLFLTTLAAMAQKLAELPSSAPEARPLLKDAREVAAVVPPESIDGAVTSPPYLNEVDYLDNTRLELFFLDFVRDAGELKDLKRRMLRANAKYLYTGAPESDCLLKRLPVYSEIGEIVAQVRAYWETRSWGWDHPRLVHEYFAGMAEHLQGMLNILKPGARYDMMVGDSAIDRVLVPTDVLLRDIGLQLGFSAAKLASFRSRGSSRHTTPLREAVITFIK